MSRTWKDRPFRLKSETEKAREWNRFIRTDWPQGPKIRAIDKIVREAIRSQDGPFGRMFLPRIIRKPRGFNVISKDRLPIPKDPDRRHYTRSLEVTG